MVRTAHGTRQLKLRVKALETVTLVRGKKTVAYTRTVHVRAVKT